VNTVGSVSAPASVTTNGIGVSGDGFVYAVGNFDSEIVDLGGGVTLDPVGARSVWLAKYSPPGDVVWALVAGGAGSSLEAADLVETHNEHTRTRTHKPARKQPPLTHPHTGRRRLRRLLHHREI
jgi:hypothetical protein